LAGYTAGKPLIDREGVNFVPLGLLGQAGITWAVQPNDAQGNPVVTQNGTPEAYGFTAELGSKITDWAGVFAEYGVSNTFPGWKAATGPIDIRATHFFSVGNHELLVGIDSNNDPSVQDVWNTVPSWGLSVLWVAGSAWRAGRTHDFKPGAGDWQHRHVRLVRPPVLR
jgi:hypothetical protein